MSHIPINDDQDRIINFLTQPSTYGEGVETVERYDTHISHIFLAGDRAYKLKRAVVLPYLDFSTLDLRRKACEAEIIINQRTAPHLYLRAVPIVVNADDGLSIGGVGDAVEWLVEMERFDNTKLLSHTAQEGNLTSEMMRDVADTVSDFHRRCLTVTDGNEASRLCKVIQMNHESFMLYGNGLIPENEFHDLCEKSMAMFSHVEDLITQRETDGFVRHCHGDLHLNNICVFQGKPTLFDAIEFNQEFAEIDTVYDLAFLLMDLDFWQLRPLANTVLNQYLDVSGDHTGLKLLPLFLSLRAAVRSHVGLAKHQNGNNEGRDELLAIKTYFRMAVEYLSPEKPELIAVGGLSGSGKSTLARAIAPYVGAAPGARIVRSDAIRKRLCGVGLTDRLGPDGYTPEVTEATYKAVLTESQAALEAGHSVICDAVSSRENERESIEKIATDLNIPFKGIWLEAPDATLLQRVGDRVNDVSDATQAVVQSQLEYEIGTLKWSRIDAAGGQEESVRQARQILGL